MIKRIIGLLVAAAVIAIIVFAVMNRSKYSSMFNGRWAKSTSTPVAKPLPAHHAESRPAWAADSLALDPK